MQLILGIGAQNYRFDKFRIICSLVTFSKLIEGKYFQILILGKGIAFRNPADMEFVLSKENKWEYSLTFMAIYQWFQNDLQKLEMNWVSSNNTTSRTLNLK